MRSEKDGIGLLAKLEFNIIDLSETEDDFFRRERGRTSRCCNYIENGWCHLDKKETLL